MADVVTLARVEVDEEGFPVLPLWAAERVGLREDQRRLVVLAHGRVELAHRVVGVEPVPIRGPEPPV